MTSRRAGRWRRTTSSTASSSAISTSCPFGRNRRFGVRRIDAGERHHRRLAVQRHHDAPGGHAAVDHREQHRGDLRRAHAAEHQRQRSAPERAGRGSARTAISTPPSTASRRRSRSATSRSSRRCSARTASRNVDLSFFKNFDITRGHEGAVPFEALNAFNRVQFSATQHQRDLDVVRRDYRPGQRAAAAAVRPEAVVVTTAKGGTA